jgi:hypothetical protein
MQRHREGRMSDRVTSRVARASRGGLSRRELIKRGAVIGGAAWTAPLIVESLASPAGAVTGTGLFGCSYATVVFKYNNDPNSTPYAVKITGNTCTNENGTSGGASNEFSFGCGSNTFSNTCSGGTEVCMNGDVVLPNVGTCPVSGDGTTFVANAGVTILWVGVHDGKCSPGHTCNFCGPITTFTVNSSDCQPHNPN